MKIIRGFFITISIMLIIVWMLIVFKLSNQTGMLSGELSGSLIKEVLGQLGIEQEILTVEFHSFIRKIAHFIGYMLGGMLLCGFFYISGLFARHRILLSLLIGVIYAISDEIHQIYVPGRDARAMDILIDSTGLAIGVFLTVGVISLIQECINSIKKAK